MRYRQLIESQSLEKHTMSGDDMVRYIINHEDKNSNVFDRLRYLNPNEMQREIHFFHADQGKIISSLALQSNPYDDTELWLKHVVVDEEYRNRGLASELYQMAVDYARNQSKAIKRSSATDMGQKYLSHVVDRIKRKNTDVEIRDQDKY